MLTGLVGWVFAATPFGSAWLGHESGSEVSYIINNELTFAIFWGICFALVLLGALMTVLVPPIGLRPRTDPDWKQFYRERNRASGLLMLSGVPLILVGMVTLAVLVLTKAGLFGPGLMVWSTVGGLGPAISVLFVLIGLLTLSKAWVLMKLVPWERHSEEPLPMDRGSTSTVGASIRSN